MMILKKKVTTSPVTILIRISFSSNTSPYQIWLTLSTTKSYQQIISYRSTRQYIYIYIYICQQKYIIEFVTPFLMIFFFQGTEINKISLEHVSRRISYFNIFQRVKRTFALLPQQRYAEAIVEFHRKVPHQSKINIHEINK